MKIKPTWAEAKVLESVGIIPAEANEIEIRLAGIALERCYYIQHAAEYLRDQLSKNFH